MKKIFLILVTFFCGCYLKEKYYTITISNHFNSKVYFNMQYNFPDTLIMFQHDPGLIAHENSKGELSSKHDFIKEIDKKSPGNKISIFLYSVDTLDKYGFENIKTNYRILRRYDLTSDELKSKNFEINFPS